MKQQLEQRTKLVAPDGGWGWAVLGSAVLVNMLIPGTIKSFGVLFVEFLTVFDTSPTETAWMPALCYFLYNSLGPLSSYLSVKYSYRIVAVIGGSFASGGLMLSYLANSVEFLYFSFGIMVGIGAGLSFPVTIYIVSEYFDKWRGFATGLTISGSTIGTIALSPFLRYLLDSLGRRETVLIMGGILLCTPACALLFQPVEKHMKKMPVDADDKQQKKTKRVTEKKTEKVSEKKAAIDIEIDVFSHRNSIISTVDSNTSEKIESKESAVEEARTNSDEDAKPKRLFDLSILKDPLYLVILISSSTSSISNTNFMILLPAYAGSEGIEPDSSALLLSIVSLLDLVGRIGGATLSDINLVPKHFYFVSGLGLSGIALTLMPMPMGSGYVYLAIFSALFGLGSGLYIGTTAVVMADLLGVEKLASTYGISLFVNGLLQLAGPPLCNLAFEKCGSYKPIFLTLGMIQIFGTVLWVVLPFIRRNSQRNAKEERAKSET